MDKIEFRTYTCRYFHNGSWWALDILALDDDDAKSRVGRLGGLQLLGEVKMRIPAKLPASGIIARVSAWIGSRLANAEAKQQPGNGAAVQPKESNE